MGHKRWGRYGVVSIGTTSTLFLSANSNRRFLKLINTGTHVININFGAAANSSADYPLNNGQPSEEFFYEQMGGIICGDIYGIAVSGVSKIAFIEGMSVEENGAQDAGVGNVLAGLS